LKKFKKKISDFTHGIRDFFDITEYLESPKLQLGVSAFLLLLASFTLIAFLSYLFTWKADQDKVFMFVLSDFLNPDNQIQNALGGLGAYISHFFIFKAVGLSAFLIPVYMAVFALKILIKKYRIKTSWLWSLSIFALIWLSPFLSFVFNTSEFPFGGGLGELISDWLNNFIGGIGTGIFFMVSGLTLIFLAFDIEFIEILNKMLPDKVDKGFSDSEIIYNDSQLENEAVNMPNDWRAEVEQNVQSQEDVELEKSSVNSNAETNEFISIDQENITAKADSKSSVELKEDSKVDFNIEEKKEENIVEAKKAVSNNYDPTLDLSSYKYPTLKLLEDRGSGKVKVSKEEVEKNNNQIVDTLNNYKIQIDKIKATIGPTVTLYEIIPAPGTRISKIKNLEDDIALSLAALGIRIIAPLPGKGTIGIEVPNKDKEVVGMKTMLGSEKFVKAKMDLPLALGKTISNEIFIKDLAKMPHLLIAGATGQGKSVGINSILVSLLYKKHPSQLKFVLIDPKKVELSIYRKIEKHFLAMLPGEEEAIITDTNKVIYTLNSLCIEMDNRYELLKSAGARNLKEYNDKFLSRKLSPNKGHKYMPFIVLVIDEFADLIMTAGKEVETPIARLAQLARAIGIHLIIATQRPSVNIITGMIKANFPARLAFKVMSKIDSRTILDTGGAEQLIGMGDMLFSLGSDVVRLQCPFVDTPEVEDIVDMIGGQRGYPTAFELPEVKEELAEGKDVDLSARDALFEDAARIVVGMQSGSTSMLQRRLKLGYNRAGRLMDELEAAGIVGGSQGSKPRDVLISTEMELEHFLEKLDE
tara:strand:+ start:149 stop:2584 length:2436 start_codon:yes stop_codon:yes gene_type:complete